MRIAARLFLGVLLVVTVCLAGAVCFIKNPRRAIVTASNPVLDEHVLRAHVTALTKDLGGFRNPEHDEFLERAAGYVREQLEGVGYDVSDQEFDVDGRTFRNIVAGYGPIDAPVVVLGAHYDVCGDQPGADDNASAVAGLLEVARLLQVHRPEVSYRIELVAFSLEEPPYFRTDNMGSAIHAQSLVDRGAEVRAMVALEMIGYFDDRPGSQSFPVPGLGLLYSTTGNGIVVVGDAGSWRLTGHVKGRMAGICGIPVYSINAPAAVPGLDFSDHLNYWKRGWPAVMITDTAFFRNPNYHQPSDTAETLDYARMAEVVRGVFVAVTTL